MLPFLLLLVHQVLSLCRYLFHSSAYLFASGLILFNTVLLGQSVLVSPDIILYCFFFYTLNSLYRKKTGCIILGSIILSMVSMRGMMCVCALFLFHLMLQWKEGKRVRDLLTIPVIYLPAGALILAFLYFHYSRTGWVGYHNLSPWTNAFEKVGFLGFFRNLIVLAWRFLDFGNVFMWIALGGGILLSSKKSFNFGQRSAQLLWLLVICIVVLVIPQMFYRFLLSHRYLFPPIALATLLLFSVAEENINFQNLKRLVWLSILGMISGNLWVYPDRIAKGWDSTLAHLPYYKHRKEAMDYIRRNQLNPREIGAAFPYETASKYIDLTNDSFQFAPKNLSGNRYVLYSNISNDFTDDELYMLKNSWKSVEQFGGWPVRFILYKNPLMEPF